MSHWTEPELQLLRANYADSRTKDLAAALGRTITTVYQKAAKLRLLKSAEYLASSDAGRIQFGKQNEAMKASQFQPGQAAWNKGTKGVVGVQEACRATQFKKGRPASEARNYLPVGTYRVTADGMLERKVSDDPTMRRSHRWVGVHRLVWTEANGEIPDGYVVVFKRGKKTAALADITVDSVEIVTRVELMKRNSYHTNYPPEVARLVQLTGAIKRQINKRAKAEQQ